MSDVVRTEIQFHDSKTKEPRNTIKIEGKHDLSDPKRVLELMDLLQLPKGTTATVLTTGASSIVR